MTRVIATSVIAAAIMLGAPAGLFLAVWVVGRIVLAAAGQ